MKWEEEKEDVEKTENIKKNKIKKHFFYSSNFVLSFILVRCRGGG